MASPHPDEISSLFVNKPNTSTTVPDVAPASKTASGPAQQQSNITCKSEKSSQNAEISIKDFFDFMKIAYQACEHVEGDEENPGNIDWGELSKLAVVTHVEQYEKDLLLKVASAEHKPSSSKSDSSLEHNAELQRYSIQKRRSLRHCHVEMNEAWSEGLLKSKLNDYWSNVRKDNLVYFRMYGRAQVINEGILDSVLPYIVGYKKPTKTTSVHSPIIKKTHSVMNEVKKPVSYGGLVEEKGLRDKLGRRKSSIVDKSKIKHEGDVEIHVCDEVKGVKKDFHCPQQLLVSKMGYFADVTSGQKLEDMDISVHCDIQIFDWLMRWVKRETILVSDWPLLDPSNVIPILVSASFLQMAPLLHDCLIYCHAHMTDILKTSTNLACLSDSLLTRLAAMYTNAELEAVKDRKDKIHSRLFCKMILSLAEPVPETLRGHFATLSNLFKCSKCNKLIGQDIADKVPCQPSNMRLDVRGEVVSNHTRDMSWNLNDYMVWLYGELRSWRRVYWRLWGDCHFLRCQACDSHFPAYQMEWCCYHAEGPQFFSLDGRPPLPLGRYPCCGERAYRFELVTRNTGCQFREHQPHESSTRDSSVMCIYRLLRDTIAMRPPRLVFPERLTRLVAREPGEESGRLPGKEVFWWEGIQLAPARRGLGLLGQHYTGDTKFNPLATPGSTNALATVSSTTTMASTAQIQVGVVKVFAGTERGEKKGAVLSGGDCPSPPPERLSPGDSGSSSSGDTDSSASEEDLPRPPPPRQGRKRNTSPRRRQRGAPGRQWVQSLSARSNQDGQRRFEERALRQMRTALARRAAGVGQKAVRTPAGGSYVRLEAEWRELHCPPPAARAQRQHSARQPRKTFK